MSFRFLSDILQLTFVMEKILIHIGKWDVDDEIIFSYLFLNKV